MLERAALLASSWFPHAIGQALSYLIGLANDLQKADGELFKSFKDALPHFSAGPMAFYKQFLAEEPTAEAAEGDGQDGQDGDAQQEVVANSELDRIKEKMCKAGSCLVDLCYGVHVGLYDGDFKTMCFGGDVGQTVFAAIALDAKDEQKKTACNFLRTVRDLLRLLNLAANRSVAPVSDAGALAPGLSVRALARRRSEEEDADSSRLKEEAREATWRQVVAARKKYVTFSTVKAVTEDAYVGAFKSCGAVFKFAGVTNESHRFFMASGDLWGETADEPWSQSSPPHSDEWTTVCKFLGSRDGPVDFCLAFDGRERSTRRIQEDVLGKKASVSELWLIFKGSFGKALGSSLRTRNTVLSANHIENGCLCLPVARSKLKISKREDNFSGMQ